MFRSRGAVRRHKWSLTIVVLCIGLISFGSGLAACNTQVPNALLCPSDQDSFATMNESAYAVVMEFRVGPNPEEIPAISTG